MPICPKCKKWKYSFENHNCKEFKYMVKEYFDDEWLTIYAESASEAAGNIARDYLSKGDDAELEIEIKDIHGDIKKFSTEVYAEIAIQEID